MKVGFIYFFPPFCTAGRQWHNLCLCKQQWQCRVLWRVARRQHTDYTNGEIFRPQTGGGVRAIFLSPLGPSFPAVGHAFYSLVFTKQIVKIYDWTHRVWMNLQGIIGIQKCNLVLNYKNGYEQLRLKLICQSMNFISMSVPSFCFAIEQSVLYATQYQGTHDSSFLWYINICCINTPLKTHCLPRHLYLPSSWMSTMWRARSAEEQSSVHLLPPYQTAMQELHLLQLASPMEPTTVVSLHIVDTHPGMLYMHFQESTETHKMLSQIIC